MLAPAALGAPDGAASDAAGVDALGATTCVPAGVEQAATRTADAPRRPDQRVSVRFVDK
jgi:hypothetical protein